MNNRPTLPPMDYRLWLPHCGAYVQASSQNNRQIIGTVNQRGALQLSEAQALMQARALIRGTGQVIRLHPVDPADDNRAGAAL